MVGVFPPVETDLLGLVDRADEQPDANRQQLDFGQRHLDVAGDDEPLVENTVENVDESRRSSLPSSQGRRHRFGILRKLRAQVMDVEQAYLSNGDAIN